MTINDLFAYLLIGFALFYSNNVILALLFNKLNTSNIKVIDDNVKFPLLVVTNILILGGILLILMVLITKLFNSI